MHKKYMKENYHHEAKKKKKIDNCLVVLHNFFGEGTGG